MRPWGCIGSGIALTLVSVTVIGLGLTDGGQWGVLAPIGGVVAAIAAALIGIGVVAEGVRLGMKYHQFDYADAESALGNG